MLLVKCVQSRQERLVVRVNTVPWVHELGHWEGVVLLMLIIPGLKTVGQPHFPTLDIVADLLPRPDLLLRTHTPPASITKSRQKVRHMISPNFSFVLSYSFRDLGINHFQVKLEAFFIQETYSDAFSDVGPKSYTFQVDGSRVPLFVYRSEKGEGAVEMMLRILCHLGKLLCHP